MTNICANFNIINQKWFWHFSLLRKKKMLNINIYHTIVVTNCWTRQESGWSLGGKAGQVTELKRGSRFILSLYTRSKLDFYVYSIQLYTGFPQNRWNYHYTFKKRNYKSKLFFLKIWYIDEIRNLFLWHHVHVQLMCVLCNLRLDCC